LGSIAIACSGQYHELRQTLAAREIAKMTSEREPFFTSPTWSARAELHPPERPDHGTLRGTFHPSPFL